MTTGKKILFAIPLIFQVLLIVPMEIVLIRNVRDLSHLSRVLGRGLPKEDLQLFLASLFLAVVFTLVGMIVFIYHAMENRFMTSRQRMNWVIILVLAGLVGQTIYYFKFIRKTNPLEKELEEKENARKFWET
jgi:hypothetical protein